MLLEPTPIDRRHSSVFFRNGSQAGKIDYQSNPYNNSTAKRSKTAAVVKPLPPLDAPARDLMRPTLMTIRERSNRGGYPSDDIGAMIACSNCSLDTLYGRHDVSALAFYFTN